MAKVISDEILKLKVVVNGDEAQKRVLDLELANKRLGITLKDLQQKQQVLSRQRKKDSDEYKANEKAINELTKAIADNKKAIDIEIHSMNNLSLTMEQLRKKAADLKFMMNNMAPGSKDFQAVQKELGEVNARMTTLRTGANASAMSIQNLAGKFNHYSGIVTGALAALAGVALSIKGTIDLNNKLADAQTTVAKTTGMNNEEVKELMRTYSDFDTRTSKLDLLKISEVGGRLGVPKEEIAEFTKEVDKMYVALGDSFTGGVEQVATQLGKLKNLFGETKDLDIATAFNQIGSALNELGANGAASEANIADFALRIGALPESLKPTIAETLALGAAFEESGVDSERAGTAYSSFVKTAAKEADKFAKVMNLTKKEVEDLINKDPMQFFLKFAEGAKGLDTVEMAKMLDSLKLNDQYVASIVGAASENMGRFRKSINLSNEALQEATSLTEEFNKVNNNAAAIYDKVKKSIIGAFTSETVAKALNWMIEGIGKMIGAVEDADGILSTFGNVLMWIVKVITVAVTAVISFNTAIALSQLLTAGLTEKTILYNVVQKARAALTAAHTVLQNVWNLSIGMGATLLGKLTNSTKLQTFAQARLNTVTNANAIGAMVAVIIAAVAAYKLFVQSTDSAAAAKKRLNAAFGEMAQSVAKERTELDKLYRTATDSKKSYEERKQAVESLQKLYPQYFQNITTEMFLNGKAAQSYEELKKAIVSAAKAKAAQSEIEKRAAEDLKEDMIRQQKMEETLNRYRKPEKQTITGVGGGGLAGGGQSNLYLDEADSKKLAAEQYYNLYKEQKRKDAERRKRDKYLLDMVTKEEKNSAKLRIPDTATGTSNYNTNLGGDTSKTKNAGKTDAQRAADDAAKKWEAEKAAMLKNGESAKALAIQLEIDRQNAIANLETDWYTREYMQIKADGMAAVAELEKKLIPAAELEKLDLIISKTKDAEQEKFVEIKKQWLANNKTIEDLKVKAELTTQMKLQALDEKLFKENIKKEQEQFQDKIKANRNALNKALAENTDVNQMKNFLRSLGYSDEALNEIKTWNEAKSALEEYYEEKDLDDQIAFLKEKIEAFKTMQAVLGANPIMPLNLNPAQLEVMQGYIDKLNELLGLKKKLGNKDNKKTDFSSLSQFGGGNADIFGLNPKQWQAMFTNTDNPTANINKIGAALQVAQNMFAQYSAFVQANEQKMLQKMEAASDRKQRKRKKELNEGYINQETYKKLTLANEKELEKKKEELALKAAKRERDIAIVSTIINTAMAVTKMLATAPWPVNLVMSGLAAATGALQLGTILKQPMPEVAGAEDGLYPVMRSQDKKVFNSRRRNLSSGMYNEPTLLVGEAGKNYPEMVIDGKTMKRLKPSTVQQLNSEVAQARGFEDGLYKENATSGSNDEIMLQMMGLIRTNIDVLNEIRETGITAIIAKTARNGKEIDEMRQEYLDLKNKNKH